MSNEPVGINESATGDCVLAGDIPEDALSDWEIVDAGHVSFREWCVPADVLNRLDWRVTW